MLARFDMEQTTATPQIQRTVSNGTRPDTKIILQKENPR